MGPRIWRDARSALDRKVEEIVTDRDAKLCDVAVELRHETHGAFLIFDGARTVWVPKSQVEYADGVCTMPEWLAKEKGLI